MKSLLSAGFFLAFVSLLAGFLLFGFGRIRFCGMGIFRFRIEGGYGNADIGWGIGLFQGLFVGVAN